MDTGRFKNPIVEIYYATMSKTKSETIKWTVTLNWQKLHKKMSTIKRYLDST